MKCIEDLGKLRVLDVSNNRIRTLEGVPQCPLEDLWCNDNEIDEDEGAMRGHLSGVKETLTTMYMENNPAVRENAHCPPARMSATAVGFP